MNVPSNIYIFVNLIFTFRRHFKMVSVCETLTIDLCDAAVPKPSLRHPDVVVLLYFVHCCICCILESVLELYVVYWNMDSNCILKRKT